ncbi:hypothetical protein HK103_003681 [Boothiomyces macroporosus]|uniref:Uncharacterized protein n=1 Tax=Boothiomyces macroporosus TaxID=261099 RepID=A0AAD5ULC1_9FUNG|nr:hypothetical protein HK103_003681 [Boothiomyces macroporosus]
MTFGFRSFQDSYFYNIPQSPASWLFPVGAKGSTYCQISNVNETDLLLAGSSVCYNNFQCSAAKQLLYFSSSNCQGSPHAYSTTPGLTNVSIGGSFYDISLFTVTTATEGVYWTTYITSFETPLVAPEPLWILGVCIIVFALSLNFIHTGLAAMKAYKSANYRRVKYAAYVVGYIFNILECICVFLTFAQGVLPGAYSDTLFGLNSGFNVALNGVCLMEIVFRKPWQRAVIIFGLIVMYVLFGFPYVFDPVFYQDWVSNFGVWLNTYFNSISYPVWQIFCFAFDPITAGIIIIYIIQSSMHQLEDNLPNLLYIMFNDVQLVLLAMISILNFVWSVFSQLETTYTLFARSDKEMAIYQIVFSLQHSINSCCTLWYCSYFPQVLTRMQALKKSVKSRKSLRSYVDKRSPTIKDGVSEPQKESNLQ